jgi:phospholipid-binding lipoprotein MlaA
VTAPRAKTPFLGLILGLLLALGACATASGPDDDAANDPLEPMNRSVFTFNQALDTMLFRPAAELYQALMPPPARTAVSNALENLRAPLTLVHDVLQGEGERAGTTLARFAVNSTVGVLGFGDPAADMGLPGHEEDLGQTFGAWGVDGGPYLVLPVLGPSNPRDALGKLGDMFIDPVGIVASNTGNDEAALGRTAADALDTRVRHLDTLDQMERTSVDFYAALRSAYNQRRVGQISNGRGEPSLPSGPTLELDAPASPAPPVSKPEAKAPEAGAAEPPPAAGFPEVRPQAPSRPVAKAPAPRAAAPATPKAKAVAAPVVPAEPIPTEGFVHLGSFADHEEALKGWEAHEERFGGALAGAEPTFSEVSVGGRTLVRLIAAFPDQQQGRTACESIQADNAFCRTLN